MSGYFGFGNLGDEAILASAIHMLKGYFGSGTEFVVLSADPERTEQLYHVESVNRWDFTLIRKAISTVDIVISGGGGLLQDETSIRSVLYYLMILLLANLSGKETYVLAQGVGPIKTFMGRNACRNVLRRIDGILVRDAGSFDELEGVGIRRACVLEGRDLVLGLPESIDSPHDDLEFDKRPVVGIALRDFWGFDTVVEDMAELADHVILELGGQVIFLLMHGKMDHVPTEKVRDLMKAESLVIGGDSTYSDMLDVIGALDLVIGVRLHSLVFSMIKLVPHIGIAYSPKVVNFMSQSGLPCFDIPFGVRIMKETICDMLENRDRFQSRIAHNLREQRNILYRGVEDLFARSKFARLAKTM
jgi:polysaccharide pyruvyl transferase CsaB